MTYQQKVIIGDCTLILGDCREVLPTLGRFGACITDPPYGINESGGEKNRYKHTRFTTPKHEDRGWDAVRPEKSVFDLMLGAAETFVCWGGNYFADYLPPSMGWLYWDKMIGGDFSDGELAYTNRQKALRSFSMHPFHGLAGGKDRQHPTQKPIPLMRWCIEQAGNPETILDPFMGSASTGVAAVQMGRKFTGIEKDSGYFEIACQRIEQAYAQGQLFTPERAKQVQEVLV